MHVEQLAERDALAVEKAAERRIGQRRPVEIEVQRRRYAADLVLGEPPFSIPRIPLAPLAVKKSENCS